MTAISASASGLNCSALFDIEHFQFIAIGWQHHAYELRGGGGVVVDLLIALEEAIFKWFGIFKQSFHRRASQVQFVAQPHPVGIRRGGGLRIINGASSLHPPVSENSQVAHGVHEAF